MGSTTVTKEKKEINVYSLLPFLLVTFLTAWSILFLYIFFPEQMAKAFGQLSGNHPLFFLAVYAPAIAAFTIIIAKTGTSGLRLYLKRFLLCRASVGWYLFLLVGIPIIFYLGAAINGNLADNPFPVGSLNMLFIALFFSMIKGPIEEFGWRGFALPLLQRKLAPFWASIVLGGIWGVWHLPAFLLSGTQQSSWSFLPFFLGTIVISILMTALYNRSQGSIFLAAVMHFQLMNPIWPDAAPYDTLFLAVAAVIVIVRNRDMMFKGKGSLDWIFPQEKNEKQLGEK